MITTIDLYATPQAITPAGGAEDGAESSDLALARSAGSGDTAALGELYRRHHRRVFSLCRRMTENTAEAEDLMQEVFIKLFYEVGTFRGVSAFTTWLHRLTVNVVLMYLRKHRRRFERPTEHVEIPGLATPDAWRLASGPALDRVRLERALAELPPGYRVVFVLFDVEGYTHDEIARLTGRAEGTCKTLLHRARKMLRERLQ